MSKCLDRIGDVLVNRRLHFADPARFNDPLDCALGLDLRHAYLTQDWVDYFIHLIEEEEPDSTPSDRRARAEDSVRRGRHTDPEFVDEAEASIRREVRDFGRKLGVLCLSSDPKNVMMWAHYADNHEGLVLRFDSRYMVDQASNQPRGFQVKYGLSFPQLPEYLAALRSKHVTGIPRLFLCRKSSDWRYEKEWRLFVDRPNSFVEFEPPMLSGVIFGCKMPEGTRRLVTAWAASLSPQPKLLQAEPYADRFQMQIMTAVTGVQLPPPHDK